VRDSLWANLWSLTEGDGLKYIPSSPGFEIAGHVTWGRHRICGWLVGDVGKGSGDPRGEYWGYPQRYKCLLEGVEMEEGRFVEEDGVMKGRAFVDVHRMGSRSWERVCLDSDSDIEVIGSL
jgi:hypothetical protein